MKKIISKEYKELLLKEHNNGKWSNIGIVYNKVSGIVFFGKMFNIKNILDYGSGKSHFKKRLEELFPNEFNVIEYDPGIESKSKYPEPCEYVICIDVLEHIEPEFILNTLDELEKLILKIGYFNICLIPAHATLSDGRNAHICLKSYEWWINELKKRFVIYNESHSETNLEIQVINKMFKK